MKQEFDWSLMPVDTVVEIQYQDYKDVLSSFLRHFAEVSLNGNTLFYAYGDDTTVSCNHGRLVQALDKSHKIIGFKNNPILPWFGGMCPVHPYILVKVWFRDSSHIMGHKAIDHKWSHIEIGPRNIIAYQIIDQEIPG